MPRFFFAVGFGFALLATVWGTSQPIEKRGRVSYSADDWAHCPTQPVGGMKALVSRLDYPASVRQQNITGAVKVRVSLDATGRLLSAEIIQSVHPTLDAIVLRAVRQTQWKPAMKAGKNVPCTFKFPVTFTRHA